MKNQQKGFTLIELLVVIVIIGILATISTATFSGYFRKARDTERQTFVRNAQQIAIAALVSADTPDYDFGGADAAATEANFKAELATQGYDVPAAKNSVNYYYAINGAPNGTATAVAASEFIVFSCIEDNAGVNIADTVDPSEHVFSAGSVSFSPADTPAAGEVRINNMDAFCGDDTAAAPTVTTENGTTDVSWTVIDLG